jgi:hypothetical protein
MVNRTIIKFIKAEFYYLDFVKNVINSYHRHAGTPELTLRTIETLLLAYLYHDSPPCIELCGKDHNIYHDLMGHKWRSRDVITPSVLSLGRSSLCSSVSNRR